jgi:hypothetical protein
MEKIIQFDPAYDKRHPHPSQNYGIHGVDLRFVLKGELGATQFVVFTNWQLPHVTEELLGEPKHLDAIGISTLFLPLPADVGYHSPTPMYDGQEPMSDRCEYLDGRPCYYDGSGLQAERLFSRFVTEGEPAVWKELEEVYVNRFGELR